MFSRLIIAAAIALFIAPVLAQEHPEHPGHAQKGKSTEKRVSTADISAGIRKNIDCLCGYERDGRKDLRH